MAFDKNKYNSEYKKSKYKRHSVILKPDFDQEIANYLYWHNISFNELVVNSIRAYLDREHTEK